MVGIVPLLSARLAAAAPSRCQYRQLFAGCPPLLSSAVRARVRVQTRVNMADITRLKREAGMEAELVCRPATMNDREAILQMCPNIYEGEDYLPARYTELMADPNIFCFVALKQGKPVSFLYREVLDDGETQYTGGVRVAPWCRGQGILRQLTQYCEGQMSSRCRASRLVLTTIDRKTAIRQLSDSSTAKLVTMRDRIGFELGRNDLASLVKSRRFSVLREELSNYHTSVYNGQEAATKLLNLDVEHFTQDDHWIVDWQPYRPVATNYDAIFRRTSLITSRDVTSLNWARQSEAISGENTIETLPHPVRAVTFVTPIKVQIGLAVWVDFHPHCDAFDPQLLISTLLDEFVRLNDLYHEEQSMKWSVTFPLKFFPASLAFEQLKDAIGLQSYIQTKSLIIAKDLTQNIL